VVCEDQTVQQAITLRTQRYATLPLFQAIAEDRIPVERFSDFFHEQYMTARWFQDVIWAATDIPSGRFAEFAVEHRRRDSNHHRWMQTDLENFGLAAMTDNDWFRFEWLPTRIQMSRILSRCHAATAEDKMIILACMESAGEVTLGTLHQYVVRHGLESKTQYLGAAHLGIEEDQVAEIQRLTQDLMTSRDPKYLETVDLVFDALTTMFSEGGRRYYEEFIHEHV